MTNITPALVSALVDEHGAETAEIRLNFLDVPQVTDAQAKTLSEALAALRPMRVNDVLHQHIPGGPDKPIVWLLHFLEAGPDGQPVYSERHFRQSGPDVWYRLPYNPRRLKALPFVTGVP